MLESPVDLRCSGPSFFPTKGAKQRRSISAKRSFAESINIKRALRFGIITWIRVNEAPFGEALAAFYAHKHGLRTTSLRIGNVSDTPADKRRLSIWLKPEDLVQLVRIGLEHPEIVCEIFYGASDNARGFWDNAQAFRFGYRPQGRAEDHRDEALKADAALPPDPIGEWYQGGPYCSDEFEGGVERAPV